jgi:hypothetical protein
LEVGCGARYFTLLQSSASHHIDPSSLILDGRYYYDANGIQHFFFSLVISYSQRKTVSKKYGNRITDICYLLFLTQKQNPSDASTKQRTETNIESVVRKPRPWRTLAKPPLGNAGFPKCIDSCELLKFCRYLGLADYLLLKILLNIRKYLF